MKLPPFFSALRVKIFTAGISAVCKRRNAIPVLLLPMSIALASFSSLYEEKPLTPKIKRLKPVKKINLRFNEPSEIIASATGTSFFILADKAFLYEIDSAGKQIRKAPVKAFDLEGGCRANGKLYLSDESMRQVLILDEQTLQLEKTVQLHYQGPRNLAFESIAYLPFFQSFLMATEKAPCIFYLYNEQFQLQNQFPIEEISEVSAITYYKDYIYVLSDEQETVFKINPGDFSVLNRWKIPVINPEGICFDAEGKMLIVSDDMGKMFVFNKVL